MRRNLRIVAGAVAALLLLVLGYGLAGLVGGLIPTNADWRPPPAGITIWIESNGVHTGIVVPKVAAGVDLRPLVPPRDLADPRFAAHPFVAVGWGERDFYLHTPTWSDVRFATVLRAVLGTNTTLMHIEHVARPVAGPDVRALTITPRQYRRLIAYIRASFATRPQHYSGYASYDTFYTARGRYSGIVTCNSWTGDALRFAGIRVGAWTPFPSGVMRWF